MKLLRRLAQSGVILLDKVPANLILGQVAVSRGIGAGVDRGSGHGVLLGRGLVLLLLDEAAVGGHLVVSAVAELGRRSVRMRNKK